MPRRTLTLSALLLIALASGCRWGVEVDAPLAAPEASATSDLLQEDVSTARSKSRSHGWYPLAVGNSWRHLGNTTVRRVTPGQPPQVISDDDFELTFDLVCQEGDHVVERKRERFANGGDASSYARLRQDRTGLWEAENVAGLPECDGGASRRDCPDPSVPELPRLRYPLHPGQTWVYRSIGTLQIIMTVEARETLVTPMGCLPAWRIRIDRPGIFKPGRDRSHVWYGRAGYLQLVTHVESDVIEGGVVVGHIESEHTHYIQSISFAGRGRFLADRRAGGAPAQPSGRTGSR